MQATTGSADHRSADTRRAEESPSFWRDQALLTLLALGLIVRLPFLVATIDTPLMIVDEQHYHAIATNLYEGHGFALERGRPTSMRPPLYPAAMALLWTIVGTPSINAVRAFQIFLTLATAVLLYILTLRLYDRRVARISAGIFLFLPAFIAFDYLVLTEVLFTFLLLASVLVSVIALRNGSVLMGGAAGALLGLAALTRSVVWLFPVVLVLLALLTVRANVRRRCALAVLLVLGFAAVVGPWAVRNTRLQGVLTVVDTLGGIALRMGNYEYTPLDRAWDPVTLEGDRSAFRAMNDQNPDAATWSEGRREKWAMRAALEYMVQNPGITLHRSAIKFANFWGLDRVIVAGWQQGLYNPPPAWLALPAAGLIVLLDVAVLLLAGLGVFLAPPRDRRAHLLMILLVLFVCAMHALAFGHSRYRLPLVPIITLYAAAAIAARGWSYLRERRALIAGPLLAWTMLLAIWVREIFIVDLDRIRGLIQRLIA